MIAANVRHGKASEIEDAAVPERIATPGPASAGDATPPASGQIRRVCSRVQSSLDGYVGVPLTKEGQRESDRKLLQWIITSDLSFSSVKSSFFKAYTDTLRASYTPPSPFVLSHDILDAEASRIVLKEAECLQKESLLTLLIDGWEDIVKRSLYGTVATGVDKRPAILSLEDLTGSRGDALRILQCLQNALDGMGLTEARMFCALVTDNPTTIQAVRREFTKDSRYYWTIYQHTCRRNLLVPCNEKDT